MTFIPEQLSQFYRGTEKHGRGNYEIKFQAPAGTKWTHQVARGPEGVAMRTCMGCVKLMPCKTNQMLTRPVFIRDVNKQVGSEVVVRTCKNENGLRELGCPLIS